MIAFQSEYSIIEEGISIEKAVDYVKKKKNEVPRKLEEIERKLKDGGIDVEKIKQAAKLAAERDKVFTLLNKGKNPTIKNAIVEFANDLIGTKKYFVNSDKTNEIKIKNKTAQNVASVAGGIVKSVALFATLLFIGRYLYTIVLLITGSKVIALTIHTVLIGPFLEELTKLISVKNNFTWEYFTVFNLYEFTDYVKDMISMGANPLGAIIVRMICVGGHLAYTLIHIESHKRGDSESGFKLAFVLHAIWNGIDTMFRGV